MEVLIERLNDTGEGIGKINNKVIFIEKTVPGDLIEVKNITNHKNYSKGSVQKIIKKSPNRIKAPCPYYTECGGCQIMNLNYQDQLVYKKEKVINIFKKYGSIDIKPQIISDENWHYRNKITLQVKEGQLGLFMTKSKKIVEINNCLLVSKKMNELIQFIKENIKLNGLNQIIIREANNQHMVAFKGKISKEEALKLKVKVTSIYINDNHIYGDKTITAQLKQYKFNISKDSFFQVNYNEAIKLYDKVVEYLKNPQKVLDLYCGTGSIGIYASNHCQSIMGIEINKQAIKDANTNKNINNIKNISFKCGDVEELIKPEDIYDTIIVDPPRSGLSKKTKQILMNISSDTIIYVSCNPITLIRDIKELSTNYKLKDITLFDLFPNTHHVECVALLSLKTTEKQGKNSN